jgi:hypothetical protein
LFQGRGGIVGATGPAWAASIGGSMDDGFGRINRPGRDIGTLSGAGIASAAAGK